MMKHNNSERGRSMIEMMGYLAILMSVVVAIGRIVSSAFDTHRYSTASIQLTELATSIVKAGAIDVDYSEILADINGKGNEDGKNGVAGDNKMNLIPSSFRRAGKKVFHVFGGEVIVSVSPFKDVDNKPRADQFSISFNHLNKKQCVELAMKNWQSNQYVDLFSLSVNGKYWFWPAYGKADKESGYTFPVKRSTLTGAKKGGGDCSDNDSNVLTWIFN